jgi:dTDP-4-dehydrorhamnose 3,5-epimerase
VLYLCTSGFSPGREHGIHPQDPELGIAWPTSDRAGRPLTLQLSEKDLAAPTLAEARASGLLPRYDDVTAYVQSLL